MEKERKNLLLTFIELATEQGILKDDITEHKKKLFRLMNEVEENYVGDKKIFVQLERAIIDVIELTQHKYFDYGKIPQLAENKKFVFQALYRDLKDRFGVASYRDIKRKDLTDCLEYISTWIEPADLRIAV